MYKDGKFSCDNGTMRKITREILSIWTYDLCCARKSYFQPARDNRTCLLDVDPRAPDYGKFRSHRHKQEKQRHEKEVKHDITSTKKVITVK